ncbi:MAG: lytic transglycosylase domain-containing protein [Nitrospirota bacterium]
MNPATALAVVAALAWTGLVLPGEGRAEIFRYMAPDGSVHYSNVPVERGYRPYKIRSDVGFTALRSTAKRDRTRYYRLIDDTALKYRMDPALVRAVVRAESDYDPRAVSSAGALGLMQLMPGTAQDLAVANPFDPEENVRGGVQYLRYLLDRFNGDTALALAAYHAGEQTVDRHNGIPPIKATRTYVNRVLKFQKGYLRTMPQVDPAIYRVQTGDAVHYTTTPPTPTR